MDDQPVLPPTNLEPTPNPVINPLNPVIETKPKKNSGMVLVFSVVVVALIVLGGITFIIIQGNKTNTAALPSKVTPTLTPEVVQTTPAVDDTAAIQKDLDQTIVNDPVPSVDNLDQDINKI